jgi:hypothetical protein
VIEGHAQASGVDVGEVLVYRRVLSDFERQRVEAYLSYKFNIPMTVVPNDTAPISFADGTQTSDVFNSFFVQQQFLAQSPKATAFVQRPLTVDVTSALVLTVSAKIMQALPYWGIPFWIILTDTNNPVLLSEPCMVSSAECNGRRLFRSCFNTDSQTESCDEITEVRVGAWFTYTRNIANAYVGLVVRAVPCDSRCVQVRDQVRLSGLHAAPRDDHPGDICCWPTQ